MASEYARACRAYVKKNGLVARRRSATNADGRPKRRATAWKAGSVATAATTDSERSAVTLVPKTRVQAHSTT